MQGRARIICWGSGARRPSQRHRRQHPFAAVDGQRARRRRPHRRPDAAGGRDASDAGLRLPLRAAEVGHDPGPRPHQQGDANAVTAGALLAWAVAAALAARTWLRGGDAAPVRIEPAAA
jgi:hypothetical protein